MRTCMRSRRNDTAAEEERGPRDKSIRWSERNGEQDLFPCDPLAAEGDREGCLVDLSDPTKGSHPKAPPAEHDVGGRHVQRPGLPSHARAGRAGWPLAKSGPED